MKLAVRYCFILIFCWCTLGSAQKENDKDAILWMAQHRLAWSDFKASANKYSNAAAITASGISYSYSASIYGNKATIDFEVEAHFYPHESWYKPDLCNTHMLKHEQLHFDISALFAQKFRDRLSRTTFTKNVKAEIRKIYREIIQELDAFQDQYDTETDFSRNTEEQLRWNLKMEKALKDNGLDVAN